MQTVNDACLWIADLLLGWMLLLPRDAALVAVALLSALVLTLVRLVSTDQDLLKRCAADTRRLKQLLREARRRKDRQARGRHRATLQQIQMVKLRAEARPLVLALVPIALLAVWCFSRLAYLAPQGGQVAVVEVRLAADEAGSLLHILPQAGLQAEDGWIRRAEPADDGAVARWRLRAEARGEPYVLTIRGAGPVCTKQLIADGRHYAPPLEYFGDVDVRLALEEYRPFGVVGGLSAALPPWIVGYLILVLPLSVIGKPLLRIA
ncbi:MAG: hypothetical protein GX591_07795 [Planctomycetes bacterium]|nr:hypothetical protein [Planctomycetota bacterium]